MNDQIKAGIAIVGVFILSALLSYTVTHRNKTVIQTPAKVATSTEITNTTSTIEVTVPSTTTAYRPGYANAVKLFYVALSDEGKMGKKIGCGDSIVGVSRAITPTQGPLRVALTMLLADKATTTDNGLRNILAQSNLELAGLTLKDGVASLYLTGTTSLGGVCDEPRFKSQIEETALQFPSVKQVLIYINGKPVDQAIGGKGE